MMEPESGLAGDPGPLGVYGDDARRVSDTVTLHLLADREGNVHRWCAFRLTDGTSDGVVYDDPVAAADAQLHYKQCAYIQIHYSGISPKAAAVLLTYYRKVREAGNVPPVLVAYHRARIAKEQRRLR